MATTGEKLVELSDLSTGTALQHLLAITGGGGTGPGETVYIDHVLGTVAELVLGTVADDSIQATIFDDHDAELDGDIEGKVYQ